MLAFIISQSHLTLLGITGSDIRQWQMGQFVTTVLTSSSHRWTTGHDQVRQASYRTTIHRWSLTGKILLEPLHKMSESPWPSQQRIANDLRSDAMPVTNPLLTLWMENVLFLDGFKRKYDPCYPVPHGNERPRHVPASPRGNYSSFMCLRGF